MGDQFCRHCGRATIPGDLYCGRCGTAILDDAGRVVIQQQPSVAPAPQASASPSIAEILAVLLVVASVITGGLILYGRLNGSKTVAAGATPSSPVATQVETPIPTPTPTPAPPKTYNVGDTITLQQDGVDWARIQISNVTSAVSYKGADGGVDTPSIAGDVFIAARVTYVALVDGVTYNPFDWQVFCAGTAVDNTTIVLYGPTPQLGSGTLPNGRTATGYVIYEVPAKGEVRMSYGSNEITGSGPVFEVIIRAS